MYYKQLLMFLVGREGCCLAVGAGTAWQGQRQHLDRPPPPHTYAQENFQLIIITHDEHFRWGKGGRWVQANPTRAAPDPAALLYMRARTNVRCDPPPYHHHHY